MAHSRKENEHRLPLDPRHLSRIPPRAAGTRVFLENRLRREPRVHRCRAGRVGRRLRLPRANSSPDCDVVLQPKPVLADIAELRPNQVFWGWPHCVQDSELTQLAIDRRLTLIAFEAMNHWNADGSFSLHVFHKNNELAGYCSVLHALQLTGCHRPLRTPPDRRGDRLRRHRPRRGHRPERARHPRRRRADPPRHRGGRRPHPLGPDRAVRRTASVSSTRSRPSRTSNPSRWHPSSPPTTSSSTARCRTRSRTDDVPHRGRPRPRWPPARLIIDVSCDTGMGFSWARPTTLRRTDLRGRRPRLVLRRRPQPVAPVVLGHLGEQQCAAGLPRRGPRRPGGLGRRPRPSAARSRSATASCRTRPSSTSRDACRATRTPLASLTGLTGATSHQRRHAGRTKPRRVVQYQRAQ